MPLRTGIARHRVSARAGRGLRRPCSRAVRRHGPQHRHGIYAPCSSTSQAGCNRPHRSPQVHAKPIAGRRATTWPIRIIPPVVMADWDLRRVGLTCRPLRSGCDAAVEVRVPGGPLRTGWRRNADVEPRVQGRSRRAGWRHNA
jgi:hypothetical protein